jgi:hypothetical protein
MFSPGSTRLLPLCLARICSVIVMPAMRQLLIRKG